MKKKALLAVLLSALLLTLMPGAALAQGNSDEVLLANSLGHYLQALQAYSSGDHSSVGGLLQAAASNAKHVDLDLADLLERLNTSFKSDKTLGRSYSILDAGIASQLASIYNDCFPCGYVFPHLSGFPDGCVFTHFDLNNPLSGDAALQAQ